MIDHLTLHVTDVQRSIDFYTRALRPLGYVAKAHHEPTIGFGVQDGTVRSDFYVSPIADGQRPVATHIAFRAASQEQVRAFYDAAIAAGGRDNGRPGPRDYHHGYYAAFVLDPDGNNIEAVTDWSHNNDQHSSGDNE